MSPFTSDHGALPYLTAFFNFLLLLCVLPTLSNFQDVSYGFFFFQYGQFTYWDGSEHHSSLSSEFASTSMGLLPVRTVVNSLSCASCSMHYQLTVAIPHVRISQSTLGRTYGAIAVVAVHITTLLHRHSKFITCRCAKKWTTNVDCPP